VFGIVRPCRHHLSDELHRRWTAHLCGTCLALRDEHGQLARATTNVDTVLVSVLTAAQGRAPAAERRAGPCPLRGMRRATVVSGDGTRLAGHAAMLLAADKVADHVADRQGPFRHRMLAAAGGRVAAHWSGRATASAPAGFDPAALLALPSRQEAVESGGVVTLAAATAPTEDAVAATFAHTALVADRSDNADALADAGRHFGRLAHLLDALDDLDDDRHAGRWNPLDATGTSVAQARAHTSAAVDGLRAATTRLHFDDPHGADARLAHRLLVHETARARDREEQGAGPAAPAEPDHPGRPPRGLLAGCGAAVGLCCTGQLCCADEFVGPWSGRPRSNWCGDCCDCSECGCDCCECGDCSCDCCSCDC
jgi:hypothetical protein